MADCFDSMWRLKRNCMKRWKTLQWAFKCLLASLTGWRKSRYQISCIVLWENFQIWWKKWWSSFGDGWTVACVRIHSYSSELIRDWWVGSSQVHLCWLAIGESNCAEEQTWRLQRQIWPTSSYRYPKARSGICAWYSLCNLTDLWLVSATMAKNVETAIDKELGDLVSTLGNHRLRHHEPCMAGTCTGILQEFDRNLIIDIRVPVFVPDSFFFFFRSPTSQSKQSKQSKQSTNQSSHLV